MREPTNERTNKKNAFKVFVFAGWVFPFQFCVLRVSKIESNNPPKNFRKPDSKIKQRMLFV
jgi:hypothetical protein